MSHDVELKPVYGYLVDRKNRFNLSAIIATIGTSGVLAASNCIDDKLWKYPAISWGSLTLVAGLYCMYKNMSYENKIKLSGYCHEFGKCCL